MPRRPADQVLRPNDGSGELLGRFRASLDPGWIDEALEATGTATIRRRRLPAEQVVWLVLGMGIYRNKPITEIVAELDLALPGARGPRAASSSVTQARERLGSEPIRWLFERCAEAWAHGSARRRAWRGLAVYGVDGTTIRLPDSESNREHFSCCVSSRGESAYPMARLVTLMALRSHLLAAARFGAQSASELSYAKELWPLIPDESLTIVDRNFLSAAVLVPIAAHGHCRHWLIRAKSDTTWKTIRSLGRGDWLVEKEVSHQARAADPSLPERWEMRAVRYQRTDVRAVDEHLLHGHAPAQPDRDPADLARLILERTEHDLELLLDAARAGPARERLRGELARGRPTAPAAGGERLAAPAGATLVEGRRPEHDAGRIGGGADGGGQLRALRW